MKTFWIIVFIVFSGLFVWSLFVEPNLLTVKKISIKDNNLKGLKIVFASDLHIKPWEKIRLKRTVNKINEQNADIILLGGDYVSGHKREQSMPIEEISKELGKLNSKYGTYGVIGNHDGWQGKEQIIKTLHKEGIHILLNDNIRVRNFYIAGLDDLQTGIPDINKTLHGINLPTILLSHTPDVIENVPFGVNLTLAGHLHGGQITIPYINGPVPSKFGRKYLSGLNNDNGKKIYVTKGLGTSIIPLRFNCLPEIVVIEFD